jgi:hypothetical protein
MAESLRQKDYNISHVHWQKAAGWQLAVIGCQLSVFSNQSSACFEIVIWLFEFVWDLVLGIWKLSRMVI